MDGLEARQQRPDLLTGALLSAVGTVAEPAGVTAKGYDARVPETLETLGTLVKSSGTDATEVLRASRGSSARWPRMIFRAAAEWPRCAAERRS